MLTLSQYAVLQPAARARPQHPVVACGILTGRPDPAGRFTPIANAANPPVVRELDAGVLPWRVPGNRAARRVFRCYGSGDMTPSKVDLAVRLDEDVHQRYGSVRDRKKIELRSWLFVGGKAEEELIGVV